MKSLYFHVIGVLALVCLAGTNSLGIPQAKTKTRSASSDKAAIEALEERYIKAFNARDVNAIMENYAPGDQLFVFDAVPPRQYASWDAYKKDWESLFSAFPGALSNAISDLNITVVGTAAYAHHIETGYFIRKDGTRLDVVARVTDVFRKTNGIWIRSL
jgi:ketosteroid isomerase-like protein